MRIFVIKSAVSSMPSAYWGRRDFRRSLLSAAISRHSANICASGERGSKRPANAGKRKRRHGDGFAQQRNFCYGLGPVFHGHQAEDRWRSRPAGNTARRPRRQRCGGTLKGRQRIPKYRIVENAGLFDLRLSAENMKRIDGLGRRLPFGRDPDVFGGHIG